MSYYTSYDAERFAIQREGVLEQLNSEESKKDIFYLRHVSLKPDELKKILKEQGIDATVEAVNVGDMYGDMYRVKKIKF